jgi:hypothetical protein
MLVKNYVETAFPVLDHIVAIAANCSDIFAKRFYFLKKNNNKNILLQ